MCPLVGPRKKHDSSAALVSAVYQESLYICVYLFRGRYITTCVYVAVFNKHVMLFAFQETMRKEISLIAAREDFRINKNLFKKY
jgi:hypothetical protein